MGHERGKNFVVWLLLLLYEQQPDQDDGQLSSYYILFAGRSKAIYVSAWI